MNIRRFLLGTALAVAVAAVAPALEAEATSLAPLTTEQLTDASTYIVRGTVTQVWTEVDDETGYVWTRTRLRVTETLKGPDAPAELIVDTIGGRTWEHVTELHSQARFSETENVLVFLADIQDGRRLTPVGMFLGKYTIRRAPGEQRSYAMRWEASPNAAYDGRFLPHPNKEARVYVDDLIQSVERRLAAGWDGQPIPGLSAEKLREINAPERREVRR